MVRVSKRIFQDVFIQKCDRDANSAPIYGLSNLSMKER